MLDGAFEPEGAGEKKGGGSWGFGGGGRVFIRFRSHICRGLLYAWC